MKTLILLALTILSTSLFAKEDLLHRWKMSYEASSNGGKIRGYQRWVHAPMGSWSVADLTVFELPAEKKEQTEMIPELLKSTMELQGFIHTKTQDSERYEGYSPKLRRQVVIHLTTTPNN